MSKNFKDVHASFIVDDDMKKRFARDDLPNFSRKFGAQNHYVRIIILQMTTLITVYVI